MKKSIVAIILVSALVAAIFSGCSKLPEEPPENSAEKHSFINPIGETAVADDEYSEKFGSKVKYIKTIQNVELSLNSYYVYGKNAASMSIKELTYEGLRSYAEGFVEVKMITIGKRADNMKIGYTAYDKDGNSILRSHVFVKLKGVKRDEAVEQRFFFPPETAKIVFNDYVDSPKK